MRTVALQRTQLQVSVAAQRHGNISVTCGRRGSSNMLQIVAGRAHGR